MNYSLYLFGTNKGAYIQYPSDGEESFLRPLCANVRDTQLTIYRKDALTHYAFFKQLSSDSSQVFGICIVTNGIYVKDIKVLYQAFESIYSRILFSGKILKLNETGKVSHVNTNFASDKASVEHTSAIVREIITENLEPYVAHSHQNYSGLISVKTIALEERNSEILKAIEQNNVVHVYTSNNTHSPTGYIEQTISNLSKENNQLKTEYSKLQSQKKQYRSIVLLSILILGCLVGLYFFHNEVNEKVDRIKQLEQTISDKDATITELDNTIVGLNASINNLNTKLNTFESYSFSTGASIRNNNGHDNGWILWLRAKRKISIESFYVKGQSSGSVRIGLFDTNDNLIAATETNVSNDRFIKVNVGSNWIVRKGVYYLKILDGVSLQYHSSSDSEYEQFSGGALEVTGACGYGNRNDDSKRTSHGYYQYFYNIQYHIVLEE